MSEPVGDTAEAPAQPTDPAPDAAPAHGAAPAQPTDPVSGAGNSAVGGEATIELTEEAVVALIAERDEYLDALQRLKAEFANARRRHDEQAAAQRLQAAADLVEKLLPVLDSCDAALDQGVGEIKPISDALHEVLSARGLRRVDPAGQPFDPQLHEAVLHEAGDGEQVVTETLRPGYAWNDKVLRPAMVKVKG